MSIFSDFGITESAFTALVFLYLALVLISIAVVAVLFYLKGFGIYKMCRKLEIKGKWRGFVPFLNVWALGDLSVYGNEKKSKLKSILTVLFSLHLISCVIFTVLSVSPLVKLLFAADYASANGTDVNPDIFLNFNLPFVIGLLSFALYIAYRICAIVCCYNIYKIFSFKNKVILTIISLFLPVLEPILIYSVCKNEPYGSREVSFKDDTQTGFQIYDEE